jgi:hypothetical protein
VGALLGKLACFAFGSALSWAGRRGEALTWDRERGFGQELIFDPRTATVLAEAEMIFGPPSTDEYGVPPRTVFRETAYLGTRVVDAKPEAPGAG